MAILKAQNFELEFSYFNLNSCNEIEYLFDIKLNGKPFFNPDIINQTNYSIKNGKFIISDCWDDKDWLLSFFYKILTTKKGSSYKIIEPPEWSFKAITWEDERDAKEKSWEGQTVKTLNEKEEIIDIPYSKAMKIFIPLWENDITFNIGFPDELFNTPFSLSLETTFSNLTKFLEGFSEEMKRFYLRFSDRVVYLGNGKYEEKK